MTCGFAPDPPRVLMAAVCILLCLGAQPTGLDGLGVVSGMRHVSTLVTALPAD